MSKKKRFGVSQALTRGISETIHVVENNSGIFRNVILPLSRIELDPDNPRKLAISIVDVQQGIDKNDALYERKSLELEKLKELAHTIESSGVINPIVVYKRGEFYRVVAGERRTLASMLANKLEIEARVFNEKPKGFELKLIQWIENTAREDLNLDERIQNIREILHEYQRQNSETKASATLLKSITGLSLSQATYYMTVLNAPDDVHHHIENGKIRSLDKAAIIASIDSAELRKSVLQACIDGSSLKELRKLIVQGKKSRASVVAPISIKRGRTTSRINMGSTLNVNVVETVIESVVSRVEFKKYADAFAKINWKNFDEASRAFKKLIEILEYELVG
ncbi:MAG TPA: ParB/RepB/Spo0J family partition protein [Gammaproteobacteria bacterium]|jgi:ParB family chromosome partitioning protein|nr:ParB/RepB/Spo0J family partition protein [Gammaproteobacteria bacterium]